MAAGSVIQTLGDKEVARSQKTFFHVALRPLASVWSKNN